MVDLTLFERINSQIQRLSDDHSEENTDLINNVLLPMLQYIRDHEKIMEEIARISSKHGI
jgi:hypothetical protein